VGVVGYTLGGGVGWLARQYGLAIDSVRWIDLVTPDGQLRRASPTENSDLFWALRGGGGNFGVVTALEFNLYPVAAVYGGSLTYPLEHIGEALRFYRDWVKTVPEALTSSLTIFKYPPLPHFPAELRGKIVAIMRAAYTGSATQGQALLRPWLDWQAPAQNTFHEMPFIEVGAISDDPVNPVASSNTNVLFDALSDAAIDTILRHATDPGSPLLFSELRHVGGAVSRVDTSSAQSNRDATFLLHMAGATPTPEMSQAFGAYITRYKEALRPHTRGGLYLNFTGGSDAHNRIKEAYPVDTLNRLAALKEKYDPDHLFRYSYPLVDTKIPTA
jgi:hypothetical protein